MLEGITAGFILSLTLFPGTVWLIKVGVGGTAAQAIAVGLGFWLSQLIWLCVAIPGLMMMYAHLQVIRGGMHLFAAFVLGYMALKFFKAPRVQLLDDVQGLAPATTLFRNAFNQSLAMPMRLPAAMAILLATGVFINHRANWEAVPEIMLGAVLGVSWWWGQFTCLAILFVRQVSYGITMRSLNKMRPFCSVLCLLLAGFSLVLGLN